MRTCCRTHRNNASLRSANNKMFFFCDVGWVVVIYAGDSQSLCELRAMPMVAGRWLLDTICFRAQHTEMCACAVCTVIRATSASAVGNTHCALHTKDAQHTNYQINTRERATHASHHQFSRAPNETAQCYWHKQTA